MRNSLFLAVILAVSTAGTANGWMLAIKNGQIFTMADGIIEDGVIIIENNRIAEVGRDVEIPSGAEIIDASGKLVTPGLFDAFTQIGLVEVSLTPSTVDIDGGTGYITAFIGGQESNDPCNLFRLGETTQGATLYKHLPLFGRQ